jgi:hypothetical protein
MDWLIVEWLILVLVTPVVITVVVLLYGFVGCGSFGSSPVDPSTPTTPTGPGQPAKPPKPDKLSAKAAGPNLVKLTWQYTTPGVQFTVERTKEGTTNSVSFNVPGSLPNFDDTVGLDEGTTYFYTVRAVLAGVPSDPSDKIAATTFPEAPADVDPRPKEVNRIDLSWTNKSATAPDVIIEHDSPTTGLTVTKTDKNTPQPRQFTVAEGSEHKFRVFATVKGYDDNVQKNEIRSAVLPQKPAKPLAFKAVLTTQSTLSLAGYCLVQRLASTLLKNSGGQVWLTVSPPPTGTLKIDRIYLSEAAAVDAWDSAGPLAKVIDIDQGDQQLSLVSTDPPKRLDPVPFNLNQANDLLISFDINASAGDCPFTDGIAGATAYYKSATQQAASADRSPNAADPGGTYGFVPLRHCLITEIEVL